MLPEATWVTPIPDAAVAPERADPAEIAEYRESIRLAFVAALQHLPARQRAALDPVRGAALAGGRSGRAARHLSVPAVNSALQRARATLGADLPTTRPEPLDEADAELLERYVDAFERYDIDELVTLLHEDAVQSMPPFEMWLRGADRHRPVDGPAGPERLPGLPPPAHARPTAVRPSASTGGTRPVATPPGPSRCSRSPTDGSPR